MSEIEQIFIKEEVFLEGDDDDDEDIEDALSGTPDVLELEDNEEKTTIPEHSQSIYWNVYNNFMDWKKSVGMTDINPDVLLAYFKELSKKYKPPSLWSKYSMLKRTIKIKHNNIDIHDFTPLLDYLKKENKGYEPKKSEPLTVNDVKKFLSEAPDDEYLAMKVSLIVALFGGCRLCDLVKLSNKDVEEHGQIIKITLRNKRNNTIKTFVIEGEMLQPIKAYKALRPENADHDRFFLSYRNGKCINMPLGKNKFGTMPKEIAQFLKLPNPEHYTGHSFKRSSTSLCKEKGISMSDLKRLNAFRKTTAVPEKKPQERVVIRNTVLPATKPLERAVNRTTVVPEKNQLESSINKTIKTKDGKVYRVIKCTDKEVAWLVGKRTPEEPILNSTQAPKLPKRIISGNPGTSHKNEIQEPEVKKSKVAEAPPKSSTNIKIVSNLSSLGDKLILYSYWRSSCSYRVRIALNLKEIPYDIKPINLEKGGGEQHGDEFRKINPMARVPALHIDNHTLIESLNILQYLEETRPQHPLLPADPLQRSQVREICDIIASGIQPLQNVGVFNHLTKQQIKDWPQFWITRGFLAIEELLSSRAGKYCVGDDITLADCCLVPQVYNARKFKIDMKPFRKILQIDQDLQNHPAFIAAHPNNQPDYPKRVGG